jgi:hypothetical protein
MSELNIPSLNGDIELSALLSSSPNPIAKLAYFWDGSPIDEALKTSLWAAWTPTFFYLLFECRYRTLNLSDNPQFSSKTMGLWDRDVVEVFIAPDPSNLNQYREVEVSPLREWVDVELKIDNDQRKSNWNWNSNVESDCVIEESVWKAAFRIPATRLFECELSKGQIYAGNFYRCDGVEPNRHYIAWQPTLTAEPDFHVPERFGRIVLT